jgi:hypothetical protein
MSSIRGAERGFKGTKARWLRTRLFKVTFHLDAALIFPPVPPPRLDGVVLGSYVVERALDAHNMLPAPYSMAVM